MMLYLAKYGTSLSTMTEEAAVVSICDVMATVAGFGTDTIDTHVVCQLTRVTVVPVLLLEMYPSGDECADATLQHL